MNLEQGETPLSTDAHETPTSRLELVWGAPGLAGLAASTVMVLGCGGVGSNCIEALARGGVGTLVVVDGDAVAPSNINRQSIAYTTTVGRRKVEVTAELVHAINPAARVVALDRFVRAEDVEGLFAEVLAGVGRINYVVDAIDTISTKLAIAEWAERTATPLIASMGGANKLDPEKLRICDIAQTSYDPLARIMRKECRRRGIRHLTVLSSFEEPRALPITGGDEDAVDAPSEGQRPTLGTASYLPPIMGQMIAGHVIRNLVQGA